jgi:hypothetical protein
LSGLTPDEVDTLVELLGRLHVKVNDVNDYEPENP